MLAEDRAGCPRCGAHDLRSVRLREPYDFDAGMQVPIRAGGRQGRDQRERARNRSCGVMTVIATQLDGAGLVAPEVRLAELFNEHFRSEPDVIARAPGRVNLIGEHTDYNDGFALPFAINRSTLAAVRLRDDRIIRVATDFAPGVAQTNLDSLDAASSLGWAAYPLGVVWALGEVAETRSMPGFDAAFTSDVPIGAGLSSSAAIECAIATALNHLWALGLDRRALAKVGQKAENVVVGAPTGILDQSASMFGARDAAVLLDCRSLDVDPVPLGFDDAKLEVLVIDTRVSHAHVDGGYGARRAACERAAAHLQVAALRDLRLDDLDRARAELDRPAFRRVRHVVTENQRVLDTVERLRTFGPASIGGLLLESHASMRDDYQISTPELDAAVEAAMSKGALGARMTGGGFGGSAIALVNHEHVEDVAESVQRAFRDRGFGAPTPITVRAVPGASIIGSADQTR